jgi:hypothetical protein
VGHTAVPHLDVAIRHQRDALALAQDSGMRPLSAHCHVSLAKLYLSTAQREQAHEHFATGVTMYREMDMRFWVKKAEQEASELA